MKKYLKLFLVALLVVTMTIFVAACGGPDKENGDKNADNVSDATNVSGKIYVFVDGTVTGLDDKEAAELLESYKDSNISFNESGVIDSLYFNGATWTQSGANVTIRLTLSGGPEMIYNCNAVGDKLTVSASYGGKSMTLNYRLVKESEGGNDGDGENKDEDGGTVIISGRAYSFKSVSVIENTSDIADDLLVGAFEAPLKDSHFIFNAENKFIAVNSGVASEGEWRQDGNLLIAYIAGEPQEFTVTGNDIFVVIEQVEDEIRVTVKVVYTYDKDYVYNGSVSKQ